MTERRYVLHKLDAGDYVFASNDQRWIYRLARDEGEGWSTWRRSHYDWAHDVHDPWDWANWELCATGMDSRHEAEAEALRITA